MNTDQFLRFYCSPCSSFRSATGGVTNTYVDRGFLVSYGKIKLKRNSIVLYARTRINEILIQFLLHFVFIVLALVMIFPFLWMVAASLKPLSELLTWPPRILPQKWLLENYVIAFKSAQFGRAMMNSIIYSGGVTILCLIVSLLAAFGFAKYRFLGRDVLFVLVLITIMFPIELTLVPLYIILKDLHWLNTFHGLIVPRVAQGFGIFLLRQHFTTVPESYLDAVRIDGSSELGIIWRVMIPLSKPTLIIVALFTFLWRWNEVLWPLVAAQTPSMHTIQVALGSFVGDPVYIPWHYLLAGITLASAPTIVLFFCLQKYIIKGIVLSGLKG